MRRQALILLLAMLTLHAVAQPALKQKEFFVGLQGGTEASMVWFYPTVEQTPLRPKWGYDGGLVFRYIGNKVVGLQVELNYMQRGWRETNTVYLTDNSERHNTIYQRSLDYIELPFLTHIYFGKRYRGFVNIGPQIGYCLNKPLEAHSARPTDAKYQDIDNPFDWGVAAGLGFYAITMAGVWQIEARFNFSLGTIYSNRAGGYFNNSNPMDLTLNIAYLWQIKK